MQFATTFIISTTLTSMLEELLNFLDNFKKAKRD